MDENNSLSSSALSSTSIKDKDSIDKNLLWSKDLNDFLVALDSYTPTIPEAVVQYYMEKSGINVNDKKISKLLALSADKFLSETIHEAKQISLLRANAAKGKRKVELSETLEMEDLERSLAQQNVFIRRKKNVIKKDV